MSALPDGTPRWWWLHNGRRVEQHWPDLRPGQLDILELGARPAAWLLKEFGGIPQLTGWRPARGLPQDLAALVARVQDRTPGKEPRLRVVR